MDDSAVFNKQGDNQRPLPVSEFTKDSLQTPEVNSSDEESSESHSLHHYDHPAEEYYEWYYEEDEEELKEEVASLAQEMLEAPAIADEDKPWPWNLPGFMSFVELPYEVDCTNKDVTMRSVSSGVEQGADEEATVEAVDEDNCRTIDMIEVDWRFTLKASMCLQKATERASKDLGETIEEFDVRLHHWYRSTGPDPRLFHCFWSKYLEDAGMKRAGTWEVYLKWVAREEEMAEMAKRRVESQPRRHRKTRSSRRAARQLEAHHPSKLDDPIHSTMQQSSGEEFISDQETPSPSLTAVIPPTQANTSIIDPWPCDHYDHPAVEYYEWYYEEDDAEKLKQEVVDIVEDQKQYLTSYEQYLKRYDELPLDEEQEPLERPWPWNAPGFLEGVHLEPEENPDDQDEYIQVDDSIRHAIDDDDEGADLEQEERLTLGTVNDSCKPALLYSYIQERAIILASEAIGETYWKTVDRLHYWFRKEDSQPPESRRLWHALWWKCLEEAGGLPSTEAERVLEESKEAREEKTSDYIERCVEARLEKAELEEQGQISQQEENKETPAMVD